MAHFEGMTDRTIRKSDELYRSQQERIGILEEEKKELMELNEQLEMENYSLKRKVSSYNFDDMGNTLVCAYSLYGMMCKCRIDRSSDVFSSEIFISY